MSVAPSQSRFRIILLGSDEIALPLFAAVHASQNIDVVAVYTQPDRPAGRGQEIKSNPVALWAKENGLKLLQPERLAEIDAQQLKDLHVDMGVVMAYGQILKDDFLAATRLGFINFHGSLLPVLRGATPVESALALGFKSTGISVQHVVRKLDAGPLYASSELTILPDEGRAALRQRLGKTAAELSHNFLDKILNQQIKPQPQDESLVTYTRRLDRPDSALDFNTPAAEIVGRVRALEGWPGSTFPLGDLIIKVGSASLLTEEHTLTPGTVTQADKQGLKVACGNGFCLFTTLQRPGGRMLPVGEFLAGCPIAQGAVIESLSMPPLVSSQPFPRVKKS
ncbi:MAG: methionyl-tRNA formyltransferase [Opitutales bacterium]|nr:methionyl-tRNA formyltransferase [Opitutales bacterium]